jgi:hypothetical protein
LIERGGLCETVVLVQVKANLALQSSIEVEVGEKKDSG